MSEVDKKNVARRVCLQGGEFKGEDSLEEL